MNECWEINMESSGRKIDVDCNTKDLRILCPLTIDASGTFCWALPESFQTPQILQNLRCEIADPYVVLQGVMANLQYNLLVDVLPPIEFRQRRQNESRIKFITLMKYIYAGCE